MFATQRQTYLYYHIHQVNDCYPRNCPNPAAQQMNIISIHSRRLGSTQPNKHTKTLPDIVDREECLLVMDAYDGVVYQPCFTWLHQS